MKIILYAVFLTAFFANYSVAAPKRLKKGIGNVGIVTLAKTSSLCYHKSGFMIFGNNTTDYDFSHGYNKFINESITVNLNLKNINTVDIPSSEIFDERILQMSTYFSKKYPRNI